MSRYRSARAALSRAFVVLTVLAGVLVGTAGVSLAETVADGDPAATVSTGPVVAGVSLGTFMWALVGCAVLVLGFIAASRSGRRDSAASGPAAAIRSYQPSAVDAQGESVSAAVARR